MLKLPGHGIAVCPNVTFEQLSDVQRVILEAENRVKMKMPKKVPLPPNEHSEEVVLAVLEHLGRKVFSLRKENNSETALLRKHSI